MSDNEAEPLPPRGHKVLPKVVLITGSVPPAPCGVGDYTAHLAQNLQDLGIDVQIVTNPHWGATAYRRIAREFRAYRPDIVHIQYPTVGYGAGLAPQALSLLLRDASTVATIHEFSHAHPLRQIASLAFAVRSAGLVFVNESERAAYVRVAPWTRSRAEVIPLASNIPFVTAERRDSSRVVYFGLIAPRKGLEDFLAAARAAANRGYPFRFEVVGTPHLRHTEYFHRLQETARGLPVSWTIGRKPAGVAAALSAATYGYLPYPDGASDRRASLLAVLGNGVIVVTTKGAHTPGQLGQAVVFADGVHAAVEQLLRLSSREDERRRLSEAGVQYARRFSWAEIAQHHLRLYHRLLHTRQ